MCIFLLCFVAVVLKRRLDLVPSPFDFTQDFAGMTEEIASAFGLAMTFF